MRLGISFSVAAFAAFVHSSTAAQNTPDDLAGMVVTATGNGGLTVGIDARGDAVACLWPTPSFYDQISYDAGDAETAAERAARARGLRWQIVIGDEAVTFDGADWRTTYGYERSDSLVAVTEASRDEVTVRQQLLVHPERDVLVSRIEVTGATTSPVLTWIADVTPCTRKLPEVPIADSALDHLNDFAAFVDPSGPYAMHFRPRQPGQADWQRAEAWARLDPSQHDWSEFGPGTWIAISAMGEIERAQVMNVDEPNGDRSSTTAVGDCVSTVTLRPTLESGAYSATVVMGFGETLALAKEQAAFARERGFDGVVADSNAAATAYLAKARLITGVDQTVAESMNRALLTLLVCTDGGSGAVVRSPSVQPHLARSWPAEGALVASALDAVGMHTRAERLLRFYIKDVRLESERGIPRGSVPASLYTDSVPASPHLVIDFNAVSRLVWSLNRHVAYLSEPDRRGFLRDVWERVEAMGAFLTTWRDARRGAPLDIPDPLYFSDAESRRTVLEVHRAMRAIIELAEHVGDTVPESWRRREEELLRLAIEIVRKGHWIEADEFLPLHLAAEMAREDLASAIRNRVEGLVRVATQLEATGLWEASRAAGNSEGNFTEIRQLVQQAVQNGPLLPPDSSVAARYVLAVVELHATPN